MITKTYGIKVPETGDRGSSFFPALEDNFTQLDGHTHDGNDSAKLNPKNFTKDTNNIASGSWSHDGNGTYSQTVSMPSGHTYAPSQIKFYIDDSNQSPIYPTIEKVTTTSFKIYVNDNTLDLVAVYG